MSKLPFISVLVYSLCDMFISKIYLHWSIFWGLTWDCQISLLFLCLSACNGLQQILWLMAIYNASKEATLLLKNV